MNTKPNTPIPRITLTISILLYLASLTQECYCTSMECGEHWSGISILGLGAIGGIMSIAGLTWYANPLLWVAWSQINKNPKKAMLFGLASTALAAGFMLFTEITDITPGRTAYITEYRLGYWLWLASMAAMSAGSLLAYLTAQSFTGKAAEALILKVNFNARCSGGIRLATKGTTYINEKQKVKLINGTKAIIWDKDVYNGRPDNLVVEALILYSQLENCWIASFNHDDLKHESERAEPLLDN